MSTKTPQETMLEIIESEEAFDREAQEQLEQVRENIDTLEEAGTVYDAKGKKLGKLSKQDFIDINDWDGLGEEFKKINGKNMYVVPAAKAHHTPGTEKLDKVYIDFG